MKAGDAMKAGGWYNRKLQKKIKDFLAGYPKLLQFEAAEIFSCLSSDTVFPYGYFESYSMQHNLNRNRWLIVDIREFKRRNHKILSYMTVQDVQAALDHISVTKIMES